MLKIKEKLLLLKNKTFKAINELCCIDFRKLRKLLYRLFYLISCLVVKDHFNFKISIKIILKS